MGIEKISFASAVTAKLQQVGQRAVKHGIEVMRDEAAQIAQLASEYAPVDEGNLEDAIRVDPVESRDGNRRLSIEIGIDPSATDSRGNFVSRYAIEVHELQEPFGTGAMKRGPKTLAKDGGRGVVGGKFFERAVAERQHILAERLNRLWKGQFGNGT